MPCGTTCLLLWETPKIFLRNVSWLRTWTQQPPIWSYCRWWLEKKTSLFFAVYISVNSFSFLFLPHFWSSSDRIWRFQLWVDSTPPCFSTQHSSRGSGTSAAIWSDFLKPSVLGRRRLHPPPPPLRWGTLDKNLTLKCLEYFCALYQQSLFFSA